MSASRPPLPDDQESSARRSRRSSLSTALVLEDFRSVRRWLIVLGVISVLAAGLSAYALVKAYEANDDAADRERVVRLERTLDAQLADLRTAIDRAGEEADITRLQRDVRRKASAAQVERLNGRVQDLADDVASALDSTQDINRDLGELSDRVETLADRQR